VLPGGNALQIVERRPGEIKVWLGSDSDLGPRNPNVRFALDCVEKVGG
jgi:hypothetical protein